MDRRHFLKTLAGLALCPLCARAGFAADAHWSYEGTTGPQRWGELDAASKVCSVGAQQSPVDIGPVIRARLPRLDIKWPSQADTIVNNGHTIQLNFAPGGRLGLGTDSFELLQVHFHRPSEHVIGGKNFPMEAHFVHRNAAGNLAVVGVLMSAGRRNAAFARVAATMPAKEGPTVKADPAFNPRRLLPGKLGYYRYPGSLTTPPCSETVEWLVLASPVTVAADDIAAFARLYPMNARPVQQANRRAVLRSE